MPRVGHQCAHSCGHTHFQHLYISVCRDRHSEVSSPVGCSADGHFVGEVNLENRVGIPLRPRGSPESEYVREMEVSLRQSLQREQALRGKLDRERIQFRTKLDEHEWLCRSLDQVRRVHERVHVHVTAHGPTTRTSVCEIMCIRSRVFALSARLRLRSCDSPRHELTWAPRACGVSHRPYHV